MNELDFAFDTKALDDDGRIEGLAAGYGNLDHGGDILLPGSIGPSLEGRKAIPMLMYHNQQRPAGVWTDFKETSDGLLVKGRFSMSTRHGKEAHGLVKDGAIGGLSIGYSDVKAKMVGKARHISSAHLHEVSLVTIPMNEKAQILSVKDLLTAGELPTVRQFEEFLRDAGGFSKSLAAAIAAKATPHLRGEPEGEAVNAAEFLKRLQAALG
jgi:HK97 family phage prohead protease